MNSANAIIELAQTYMVCGVVISTLTYIWYKHKTAYNLRKANKPKKLF